MKMLSKVHQGMAIFRANGLLSLLAAGIYHSGELASDFLRFVKKDIEGARKYSVPLRIRFRAWQHGFNSKSWMWLDLNNNDPESYINNVQARRTIPRINGEYGGVFDDSVAFYRASEEFYDNLPDYHGVIDEGQFYHHYGNASLIDILNQESELLLKPICGEQGNGILHIKRGKFTDKEIRELKQNLDDYLVTEFVAQHDYAAAIAPDSANTIRFYTIIDPETHEPHIVRAIHRFGTSESAPTDNWSRGGLCAPIDIETGRIKTAFTQDSDNLVIRTEHHPETNTKIRGVEIPHWSAAYELILNIADHHGRAPYVGWDVIISSDGPKVIEANSNPGIDLLQIEKALLEDDVAEKFFDTL